jgi:hypothetical protein
MPGVLQPDHVRLETRHQSPKVKAELFESIEQLQADVLRCISCEAWKKLARCLGRTQFEGNWRFHRLHD